MPDVPRPIDFLESSFRQSDVFDDTQDAQNATLGDRIKYLNDKSITPDLTKGIRYFKGLVLRVEQKEPSFLTKWFGAAYNSFFNSTDVVNFYKVRIPELDGPSIPLPPYYGDAKIDPNSELFNDFVYSWELINRHRTMRAFDESNLNLRGLKTGDIVWVFFNNSSTLTEPYIHSFIRNANVFQPRADANIRPATPNLQSQAPTTPDSSVRPPVSNADGSNNSETPSREPCSDIDNKLTTPIGCGRIKATGYRNGIASPITLMELPDYPGFYLQQEPKNVWQAFQNMLTAMKAAGISPKVNSTFRTMAKQKELRQKYENKTGNLAAPPGYSTHQMGLTIDFNVANNPALLDWLNKNGATFGFARTVPSENWHWEYIS